jgi:transcriptional regulator with XRE-family HTH domain
MTTKATLTLRELRQRAGLSQAALAERSGLRQTSLSTMEAGTHLPRSKSLAALAAALGVTIDEAMEAFKEGRRIMARRVLDE